jgi:hypothetical protein
MTSDDGIHTQISELVSQERALREQLQAGTIEPSDEQQRLRELEVQLDQCWDLLRQRQALRDAGADPEGASVRPAGQVEGYLG